MLNADEHFWCVGYAIQSLEKRVGMLHCHHAEEIQTETVTFYGIAVIVLMRVQYNHSKNKTRRYQ